MLQHLFDGLTALGNGSALIYLFAGALIGMLAGVIPGFSTGAVLSVMLAFVLRIDLTGTLALFLGAQAGSYFSASVTSILLNTPAHPEAFAVTFDGYPMAMRGEPGRALGLSAASTCVGGLIGCAVLVGFVPVLDYLPGIFHPPEYVALVVFALVLVGTLGAQSVTKGLISMGIGLTIASIGPSVITGVFRYEFGVTGLDSGVSLAALALGLFAIPQMVMVFGTGTIIARQDMIGRKVAHSEPSRLPRGLARQTLGGVADAFRHWPLLLQSGLIGAFTGLIPGIGGFTANFLSYGVAQQTSKRRAEFGSGVPEGIIGPEGASLAKEAGTMIPVIGLGIPGSVGTALFIAALAIKDVKAGFGFETTYPVLPYEIAWIIALTGIIGTTVGVFLAPLLARVTMIPGPVILPFVFAVSILGAFLSDGTFFSVMEMLIFGVVGLILRRLQYSLASFVMGLVLGPIFESNIYLTKRLYPGFTLFATRPLADVIFALALIVVLAKILPARGTGAKRRALAGGEADHAVEATAASGAVSDRPPYPLLGPIATVVLLGISAFTVSYGATHYDFTTAAMPVIGGVLIAVACLYQLPREVYPYLRRRQAAAQEALSPVSEQQRAAVVSRAGPGSGSVDTDPDTGRGQSGAEPTAGPPPTGPTGPGDRSRSQLSWLSPIREEAWGWHGQYTREIFAFAWLSAAIAACYLVGFGVSIAAFVALYGLLCTRRFIAPLWGRLVFAAISAAAMWAITYEFLNVIGILFVPKIHI